MAISSVENGVARRGLMVVISSPSGAGKSTIARLLLEDKKMNLSLSISVTTRQRRPSEIEGSTTISRPYANSSVCGTMTN